MKHSVQDRGTLLLALIAGLSINGTFAALFSSIVPFSIFPILSLVLTVYCRISAIRIVVCPWVCRGSPLLVLFSACWFTVPFVLRGISGHRL